MRQGYGVVWALGALGVLLLIKGCATSQGPRIQEGQPTEKSFSMTGSSLVYEYEEGKVDFETTDLLEVYEKGIIDILESPDPQVRKLLDRVPLNSEFHIVLVNGQGSPASLLQINDKYYFSKDYSDKAKKFADDRKFDMPSYSLGKSQSGKQLKKLRIHLLDEASRSRQFVSTNRMCVVQNQPGPKGEYRNGALTLQIIDNSIATFDPITYSAGKGARLFAEFSLFLESEKGKCL